MSIAIDSKSGTHFVGKIFVTPHACDRAVDHFGVERSKAPMHVMDLLRKSSLISAHVVDDAGNPARMFAYKRTVFIVHPTEATVYTLYPQHLACEIVRNPIERVIDRTVKAAERKERRELKRINIEIAALKLERAQLDLRKVKTESMRVLEDCAGRIDEIDAQVRTLEAEIKAVQREKTNVMKSIAAYV